MRRRRDRLFSRRRDAAWMRRFRRRHRQRPAPSLPPAERRATSVHPSALSAAKPTLLHRRLPSRRRRRGSLGAISPRKIPELWYWLDPRPRRPGREEIKDDLDRIEDEEARSRRTGRSEACEGSGCGRRRRRDAPAEEEEERLPRRLRAIRRLRDEILRRERE